MQRGGFQSTLPVRGATNIALQQYRRNQFQSTLPVRGATFLMASWVRYALFQSTLPVRGATQLQQRGLAFVGISIHAPREGSDTYCYFLCAVS